MISFCNLTHYTAFLQHLLLLNLGHLDNEVSDKYPNNVQFNLKHINKIHRIKSSDNTTITEARQNEMKKKCSERRKHKNFRPAADPVHGVQDGQNLTSERRSLPSPTDAVWWRSMHKILNYRGNRPTNKQTHRQDQLQCTAQQLAIMQCNRCKYESAPNSIKQYSKLHKCKV